MTHGNGKFDKDIESVENQYRSLGADEPPDMLDQAILNKARLATEHHATRPWSFGWMHATASTALVVLGFTIALQMRSELPAPTLQMDGQLGRSDASVRSATEKAASDVIQQTEDPGDAPGRRERLMKEEEQLIQPAISKASTPALLEATQEGNSSSVDQLSDRQERKDAGEDENYRAARQSANAPMEAADPDALQELDQLGRERLETDSELAAGNETAQQEQRQNSDKRQQVTAGAALAVPPESVTSPAAQSAAGPATEPLRSKDDLSAVISDRHAGEDFQTTEPPEDWLARILDLKHGGESDDWRGELEQFRALYPDYPLPEELNRAPHDE